MRLGVFGGSFDPVHIGHLVIAELLAEQLRLERVLFLPAGRPPHKPLQELADDDHRLAMLELALEDNSRFEISRLDIERAGWSYTSETLRLLRAQLPAGTQIHFLMGQDSLRDFPNWHQPGEIARQVRLGVALRPGVEASIEVVNRAVPETIGVIDLVPVPLIGVSSREIRERVRDGKTIRYLVLPAVADYVALNGLYRDESGPA